MSGPLSGVRVGVTRAREQAADVASEIADRGGVVVLMPCLEVAGPEDFEPLDAAIARLPGGYDGILFSSTNAVRWTLDRCSEGALRGVRVAATGTATSELLESRGVHVDVIPAAFHSEGLLEALDQDGGLSGTRWLLPRADVAREVLPRGLEARGAHVDRVVAYRNLAPEPGPLLDAIEAGLDAITFASGSAVRRLAAALGPRLGPLLDGVVVASIGPVTSRACIEFGLTVAVALAEARVSTLVGDLADHWETRA